MILFGTFGTAVGFLAFGYVRTLLQAAVVQAFIGFVNGNQGKPPPPSTPILAGDLSPP